MSGYLLTPLARTDIFAIWTYLAERNAFAADRVEEAIYAVCTLLAKNPFLGHPRPDLTARLVRFWTSMPYPNYTLIYRPETKPLQVIAVLHSKRNLQRILSERPESRS